MRKTFIVVAVGLMAGCSLIPTVRNCQHVMYERTGTKVVASMECDTAQGALPVLQ